jgi:hypothetical protein
VAAAVGQWQKERSDDGKDALWITDRALTARMVQVYTAKRQLIMKTKRLMCWKAYKRNETLVGQESQRH